MHASKAATVLQTYVRGIKKVPDRNPALFFGYEK
jgi:hypothetical protein